MLIWRVSNQEDQDDLALLWRSCFLFAAGTGASTVVTTCSTLRRGRWCTTWQPLLSSTTGCSTVRGFILATMTTSSASPSTHSKTTWPRHRYARPIRAQQVTVRVSERGSDWLSVCSGGQRPSHPYLGNPDSEMSVAAEGTPQQRSVCPGVYRYTDCTVHRLVSLRHDFLHL